MPQHFLSSGKFMNGFGVVIEVLFLCLLRGQFSFHDI